MRVIRSDKCRPASTLQPAAGAAAGFGFVLALVAIFATSAPAVANVLANPAAHPFSVRALEDEHLIGRFLDHESHAAGTCVLGHGIFPRNTQAVEYDAQETVEIDGEDYLLAQ